MVLKGHTIDRTIDILSENQIKKIHYGSLDVLEKVGVRFKHEKALEVLEDAGCEVDEKKKIAKFPSHLVEECLRKCPSSFTIEARESKNDVRLGGSTLYFGHHPAMKKANVDTGEVKKPTKQEVANTVKVLDALNEFHLFAVGPYLTIEDVHPLMVDPLTTAIRIRNSSKVGAAWTDHGCEKYHIRMAKATDQQLFGALNLSPPLTCSKNMIKGLFRYAEAGFPLSPTSGIAFGSSGPATMAGSLVQYNAEVMSLLVLSQTIHPGLGCAPDCYAFPHDMRTGTVAQGAIERGIFGLAFSQMWRHFYDLPCGLVLSSDSKLPDYECGYEKATNLAIGALSGCNYILMGGAVYDEMTFSPLVAAADSDLLGMVGRILEGIEVSDETLGINLIEEVGPIPGHFLNKKHTRDFWKKEQFVPDLADRRAHEAWFKNGAKDVIDRGKEKVKNIIKDHEPTPLPEEQDKEIEEILKEAKRHYKEEGLI